MHEKLPRVQTVNSLPVSSLFSFSFLFDFSFFFFFLCLSFLSFPLSFPLSSFFLSPLSSGGGGKGILDGGGGTISGSFLSFLLFLSFESSSDSLSLVLPYMSCRLFTTGCSSAGGGGGGGSAAALLRISFCDNTGFFDPVW